MAIFSKAKKYDALQAFKLFHLFIKTEFKTTIKSARTDYRGKYRPFTKYLVDLDINHKLTFPHISHQNGTVERKHRHVVEMGLTLLAHTFIPITLWNHNFSTSVYFINRIPSPNLPKFNSPFSALYGEESECKYRKVFGCLSFPLLILYNKHKL